MTHAFFKALLFLAAGSVILAMHHEQDIFRMGGLRKRLPFTFACMFIGTLALSAVPFTAGFYSKDEILNQVYLAGHHGLWLAGLVGAFLTALYGFRLIFVVFFGPERWRMTDGAGASEPQRSQALAHQIPLGALLVLALVGGAINPPLGGVLPQLQVTDVGADAAWVGQLPMFVAFAGIGLSWWLFLKAPRFAARLATDRSSAWLGALWRHGWGFDWLYERLLVRPFVWLANVCRDDPIDLLVDAVSAISRGLNRLASLTQTGSLRWYAAVAGIGLCILIVIVASP
jgi:NADH-quinone oxidoreductase subunit L